MRDRVLRTLKDAGVQMHETDGPGLEATVLGADLGGRQLEVLVGHFIAASLFNRVGLSNLKAVYDLCLHQATLLSECQALAFCGARAKHHGRDRHTPAEFLRPWSCLLGTTDASSEFSKWRHHEPPRRDQGGIAR
eukprot:6429099-Amphidinium_carterae.2